MNRKERRTAAARGEKLPKGVPIPLPFQNIMDAISRGKGSWALMRHEDGKFSIAIGSPKVVRVPKGFIAVISFDEEELQKLRQAADDMLAGITPTTGVPEEPSAEESSEG